MSCIKKNKNHACAAFRSTVVSATERSFHNALHTTKNFLGIKKLPTKMMHMAGTPNVSAFQNGKNQNPPIGPFWENWYFVSTVVRILQRYIIL